MRHLGKQENLIVDTGTTFPSPDDGELFIIDDPSNTIEDGLYWYSGRLAKWVLLVHIDELDSKVQSKVQTKMDEAVATEIATKVTQAVDSKPNVIVAETSTGDVTTNKISFSSTIQARDKGDGSLVLDYTPPMIELTMAEAININTNNEVPIRWDVIVSQASIYSFSSGSTDITIQTKGMYDVSYQINASKSSGNSANIKTFVKKNATEELRKSSNYSYMKNNDSESTSNTGRCVVDLDVGDVLTLYSKRHGKNSVTSLIPEETQLTIKLIKEL